MQKMFRTPSNTDANQYCRCDEGYIEDKCLNCQLEDIFHPYFTVDHIKSMVFKEQKEDSEYIPSEPESRKRWLHDRDLVECHCGNIWDGNAVCTCCTLGSCEFSVDGVGLIEILTKEQKQDNKKKKLKTSREEEL